MTAVAPAAAAVLAGQPAAQAAPLTNVDAAVLNFALQTEYLGASYYCYAASGAGITSNGGATDGAGTAGTVTVKANPKVPFASPLIQQICNEFAVDELGHVNFLRTVLTSAGYPVYALPNLNLQSSYNALAKAAGFATTFDPFSSDAHFLLGAFIIEDVDVTAYAGSATMITNPDFLAAAAGILAVEAYHAGVVRMMLFTMSQEANSTATYGIDIAAAASAISSLRDSLSGGTTTSYGARILGATSDQSIISEGSANIAPADANSVAFERNSREVLNILYGAQEATSGGFFPNGLNGIIS